jgi:hypothetical protein
VPPRPRRDGRIFVEPYGWVTPVHSRTGQLLYYVDASGARVGDPLAGPGQGMRFQNPPTGSNGSDGRIHNEAAKYAAERARRQDPVTGVAATAAADAQLAGLNSDYAWIDGKRVKFVGIDAATGKPTYTLDNKNDPTTKQPYVLSPPSAYGALDGDQVPDGSTQFLMTQGVTTHNGQAGFGLDTFLHPGMWAGKNFMTVANGLTWLANLSIKDTPAYQAMVDKLHNAGYLTDEAYSRSGGGYSQTVAAAFAIAARDVSVLNGQGGTGANITLDMFLGQRASGNTALGGNQRQKVNRSYVDPESIKASARSEAENVLGRQLSDAEEAQLVGHFRSLEDAAFDAQDAAGPNGGARYTTPGDGQIAAFVDGPEHEQEAANFAAGQYGMALKRLVGLN